MNRIQAIDLLRGIAVLLVLGRHVPGPPGWGRIGWTGPDLFFVLSGFLISGLLFSEYKRCGSIDIPRFILRRGLKIYPGFYLLIAVTALAQNAGLGPAFHARQLATELFFVQSYFPHIWDHTWTLAVEEHFYLILPVLLWLGLRLSHSKLDGFRFIPGVFVVFALAAFGSRLAVHFTNPAFLFETHFYPTHLRMDALFFGVLLGYLHHYRSEWLAGMHRRCRRPLALVSCALLSSCIVLRVDNAFMHTAGFTMIYLGYGGLLITLLYCPPCGTVKSGLIGRAVALIGAHSYAIYLWHMPIAEWGLHWFRSLRTDPGAAGAWMRYVDFTVYVVASILLGILVSRFIEAPVLKLRDRWLPSRSATALRERASELSPELKRDPGSLNLAPTAS